ncbi:DNA mismatch repair protein MutS [Flavobacteriaceae bacterium F08102]|nr:DNA mismatch repair protein MutS [Flavobacteriaceae bacterium F08102]
MQEPSTFYQTEKQNFELELKTVKKQLINSSLLRLGVFISFAFCVYLFFNQWQILVPITVVSFISFGFLISRHADLQLKRDLKQTLIDLNETELKVLNRDFHHLESGSQFENSSHYYSYDIDLFGTGSFFQYSNRTATQEGMLAYANLLTSNDTTRIVEKQEAIKELAGKAKWRQHFTAVGKLVKIEETTSNINRWISQYKSVFPKYFAFIPQLFALISLILIVLSAINLLSPNVVVAWFFVGLGITAVYIKKVSKLYQNSNRAKDTFKQYHQLLNEIEQVDFTSTLLQEKQKIIQSETLKASVIFKRFSKILDAFDQRNNMFVGVVGNGLALMDLWNAHRIERWMQKYHKSVEHWFEVIAFFDAQNSLANFSFNHPSYVFPTILEKQHGFNAQQLGHPLLKPEKRVDNDFSIDSEQFFIVTGANMAGKSTFLRTVSLAIVMANNGLPICAKSALYSPIKLITSMRTSDSLVDDESYFFSELKRLKFIVDKIQEESGAYFIILDEILKGTNSTDKAIGSKKFVKKLVASKATGIIATHDLSLCEITEELKEVQNYYFDAQIIDDELHFDYHFKNGICQNMNASFLLKKMEIV